MRTEEVLWGAFFVFAESIAERDIELWCVMCCVVLCYIVLWGITLCCGVVCFGNSVGDKGGVFFLGVEEVRRLRFWAKTARFGEERMGKWGRYVGGAE